VDAPVHASVFFRRCACDRVRSCVRPFDGSDDVTAPNGIDVPRWVCEDPHGGAVTSSEPINGLFKAEVIQRRGPRRNFEAVKYATLELVDWFNTHRLLEPIGNIPPAEAEANYYAALETEAMAAEPTSISLRQTRSGSVVIES
jgi:hypothetical protein